MWSANVRARTQALIEGKIFCGGYIFSAVANNGAVLFRVSGIAPCLVDVNAACSAKATVQPYSGTTYSANGTAVALANRKLNLAGTPPISVHQAPTPNVLGTALAPFLVEGGSGSGAGSVRIGAESADDFGFMLDVGDDLLVSVTNTSGAAEDIGLLVFATALP